MDALNYTGVIATLLGVIFAVAAFWNSRQRKKHEQRLHAAMDGERRRLHVKPMPSEAPAEPAPAVHSKPRGKPATPGAPAVFKQATSSGASEPAAKASAEEQGYVWE